MMGMESFDRMFHLMSFIVPVMFLLFIGVFAATLIQGIGQWNKNNNSPVLTVDASVVSKRTNFSRSGGEHHHSSTRYYATFQVESGSRIELPLSGPEYGLLVEGDTGKLTFQGTRYLGFARQ